MMTATFWLPAAEHERFGPHAFDQVIGQTVPWTLGARGPVVGQATVLEVEVSEDGSGAKWTVVFEEERHGEDGT
jgi:hypothetical protein